MARDCRGPKKNKGRGIPSGHREDTEDGSGDADEMQQQAGVFFSIK